MVTIRMIKEHHHGENLFAGVKSQRVFLEAFLCERLTGRTESILVTTSMVGCDLPDGLCKTESSTP